MSELLDEPRLAELLPTVAPWRRAGSRLELDCRFRAGFAAAMRFVNEVAGLAEAASHHPEITIRWNAVRLSLWTHSAGGLTEKDFALAGQVAGVLAEHGGEPV